MDFEKSLLGRIDKGQDDTPLANFIKEIGEGNLSFNVEKLCKDSDFSEAFTQAITDKEEQIKFLMNTSRYNNRQDDYDPKYVLLFRRTLPSEESKPEERWTDEYMQVLNGLRREIPEGPHRFHSIILCDSLEHLLSTGEKQGETNSFTDGEIVVDFDKYDQDSCVCKFKPHREKEALEEYLQTEGALSQEETLKKVQEHKNIS